MPSRSRSNRARLGLILAVVCLASACAGPAATAQPSSPAASAAQSPSVSPTRPPRVLSPDAAKVLAYLSRLSNDTEPGVIVGQTCESLGPICDAGNFQESIGALHDQSGRWPGVFAFDYEGVSVRWPNQLSAANQRLPIPYWQAGGLVMVNWVPPNPWGVYPREAWRETEVHFPGADLHELLPGGDMRDIWMAALTRIADALTELRDAGVAVLWRPMQEMNATAFWWAKTNRSDTHGAFGELWRDMFDYFTYDRNLNNLLWVFAPTGSQSYSSFPYPGNAYVDVVGGTQYDDNLTIYGYADYLAYGKPVAMSEYGPSIPLANGTFDDRLYIQRLKRDYPRVAFFVAWNSWTGVKMSLADNLHARELMNDPDVITRDEIAWR